MQVAIFVRLENIQSEQSQHYSIAKMEGIRSVRSHVVFATGNGSLQTF